MTPKVYLVTGVGSGLGSAVVSRLASGGAEVVAVARSKGHLEKLGAHARSRGWALTPFFGDLAAPGVAERLVETLRSRGGRLDGASLQTGRWIAGDTLLHKTTDAEWTDGILSNLEAIFRTARAVVPLFLAQGHGSLVLVSAAERVRLSGNVSYCTAKGGLVDLARKLARDYRPAGIRVNAILPGTMEHDLPSLDPPATDGALPLRNASGVGAWEVARAIAFLLGDESRWITGAAIPVDGGYSLHGREPEP
ncbi:3-oxoacyl-[acyl-carrier protein] reductase [mine drainage metagenome]|uniref:3-oxoacyl-[acyl-carrier protein] reductase n=1 Tax=mine drainage metagenome TaxID=410659 RepID=T0YLQ4_9ZZZZ